VLGHASVLFAVFSGEQGLVATAHAAFPVARLIHSFQQLPVAVAAVGGEGLLPRAEAAEHGDPLYFIVHDAGLDDVAVIAAEAPPAAAVSEPSE